MNSSNPLIDEGLSFKVMHEVDEKRTYEEIMESGVFENNNYIFQQSKYDHITIACCGKANPLKEPNEKPMGE
uniref:Uncharacterized protein n=1 Tax=Cucumis melo TaxID=3656 RepID=A0A9I9EA85_CUCME